MKTTNASSLINVKMPGAIRMAVLALLVGAVGPSLMDPARATSVPPNRMTYQGHLVDSSGTPLGNTQPQNFPVKFRIYEESEGGARIWSEEQVVTIDKGNFSVILGEGTAITGENNPAGGLPAVFAGPTADARYLELTVTMSGNPVVIQPRLRLLPAPYAFLASQATQLVNSSTGVPYVNLVGGSVNVDGGLNVAGPLSTTGAINASGGLTGLTASQVPSTLDGTRTFSGPVKINGFNFLEFGADVSPKEANNGKIGYGTFSGGAAGALDIVGAGANVNSRKINFHAQGGAQFIGSVGIGTANPASSLDVNGSIWRSLTVRGSDGTDAVVAGNLGGRASIGAHNGALNAWSDLSLNPDGGRVGIGTRNPPYLLSLGTPDVNQARIRIDNGANYVEFGRWVNYAYIQLNNSLWSGPNRAATYDGDSNWDFSSDRKLKKDIVDAEPMLDRAMKVQVRRYRWKEDPETATHKLGVVAQEVQPLFPHMVSEIELPTRAGSDSPGEKVLQVGYGDFALIALKSVQELKAKYDAELSEMRAQLAEVVRDNQELRSRLANPALTRATK